MAWKGRRTGGAAVALVGMCLSLTGCVQTETALQPWDRPGGMAPTGGMMPMRGMAANYPNVPSPNVPSPNAMSPNAMPPNAMSPNAMSPNAMSPNAMSPNSGVVQTSFRPRGSQMGGQPIETAPVEDVMHGDVGQGMGPGGGSLFPRELTMVSHPPRPVAPPDVLLIDAIRLVPQGPYRLEPLEVLQIAVTNTLPNQPIAGSFVISPEGSISLGFNYGAVRLGGLTLEQAELAIRKHLSNILKEPNVTIGLVQFRGVQQIRGEHLVRPDGTISLGMYGSVYVAGMTLGQIKCELEKYLSVYLVNPQLSVDMLSYNSQKYYVIFDGGGYGQQVFPLPVTGNETVLDAISKVGGLAPVSSLKHITLSRPSPVQNGCNQVLPIDWEAILHGSTATNYQIFPGDRIYVRANCLIEFDNRLAQILAPIERIFGATLLGVNTVQSIRFFNNPLANNGGFFVTGTR